MNLLDDVDIINEIIKIFTLIINYLYIDKPIKNFITHRSETYRR